MPHRSFIAVRLEVLLANAVEAKLLRSNRVRVDKGWWRLTWDIRQTPVCWAKAVGAMARTVERIKAAGAATHTRAHDRRRSAGRARPLDRVQAAATG
jgi:IS5 family transposase